MGESINPTAANSEEARAETQTKREHLRAAGRAAAGSFRENVTSATNTARVRAQDASKWARSRFTDLQGRVERRPQSSALAALGIGIAAGFLMGMIMRGGRER